MARAINQIALDVRKHWPKVNYAAKPYLDAMATLGSVNDHYYHDSGESVIRYFLANAGTWRGEEAKRIKAELKALLPN